MFILVQDINDMRIIGTDDMVVNDDLVLINFYRLACLIVAGFKDIENISRNIIIWLRTPDFIEVCLNLRLSVNPRHSLTLVLFLGCVQGNEAVLGVAGW